MNLCLQRFRVFGYNGNQSYLLSMVNLSLVITFLRNLRSSLFNCTVLVMPLRMLTQELSIWEWSIHWITYMCLWWCQRQRSHQLRDSQSLVSNSVVLKYWCVFSLMWKTLYKYPCHMFSYGPTVLSYSTGSQRTLRDSRPMLANRVSSIVDQIPPDRWSL